MKGIIRNMSELYLALVVISLSGGDRPENLSLSITKSIKSVCSILIMIGHCILVTHNAALSALNVGWYCVAIFYFISGWGLYAGYKTKPAYLDSIVAKRIPKVIIPFCTAHVIYFIIKSLFGAHFGWISIIKGLLGNANIVDYSWYPVAIVLLYFVFWIAFLPKISENKKLLLLLVIVIVITWVEYIVCGERKDWWFISNLSFFAGAILKATEQRIKNNRQIVFLGLLVYAIGYLLIPACARVFEEYHYTVYICASNLRCTGLTIAIVFGVCETGHHVTVFDALGEYSYEIYLMHGLFIWLGTLVIHNTIVLMVLSIVLTIPTAIAVHKLNARLIKLVFKKAPQRGIHLKD